MEKTYTFRVEITCDGCVKAIQRSLTKSLADKLVSVDANVETKLVNVTIRFPDDNVMSEQQVLELVKKCGKECHTV